MFDTSVIIVALSNHLTDDEELAQQRADSRLAIADADEVMMSSITFMELYPHMRPDARAEYDKFHDRIYHVPFDGAAARLAAELYEKHRDTEKICNRCWNAKGSSECRECGALRSFQSKRNDYCIAASAAVDRDVSVLYTYDFLYLAQDLAGMVHICEPSNASGKLFSGEALSKQDITEAESRKRRSKL